ncbi:SCO4225 family membrane protein [Streptomyces rimosus]|uniref:SCO4225 family membrane protein n=1 Tax=Streptomyces rimosus TaxID=1927 RepID=UPI000519B8D3|nr:hypothetical protein [Streptomyces rimosus]
MNTQRLRSLLRLTFGNRASQLYLALVTAAAIVSELMGTVTLSPFSGLLLIIAAFPALFVFLMANGLVSGWDAEPNGLFWLAWTLSVLVQAFFIGYLASRASRRARPARRPGPAPRWH